MFPDLAGQREQQAEGRKTGLPHSDFQNSDKGTERLVPTSHSQLPPQDGLGNSILLTMSRSLHLGGRNGGRGGTFPRMLQGTVLGGHGKLWEFTHRKTRPQ